MKNSRPGAFRPAHAGPRRSGSRDRFGGVSDALKAGAGGMLRFLGLAAFKFLREIVHMVNQVAMPFLVGFGLLWVVFLGTIFNVFSMVLLGLAFTVFVLDFAFERFASKRGY